MTEITRVQIPLGKIKCLGYEEACTKELADAVRDELLSRDGQVDNLLLLNSHGVLITTNDLHKAALILEVTEWNAEIAQRLPILW